MGPGFEPLRGNILGMMVVTAWEVTLPMSAGSNPDVPSIFIGEVAQLVEHVKENCFCQYSPYGSQVKSYFEIQ